MEKAVNEVKNCTHNSKMCKLHQFIALIFFISELKLLTLCREKVLLSKL